MTKVNYKLFTIILTVLFFAGCAKYIKSEVVIFHKLPELNSPTKYSFQVSGSQKENLEYITYRDLIKSELAKYRLEEVPFDEAEIIVSFEYSIDSGRGIFKTAPVYGQTGISSSTTYGNVKKNGDNVTFYETTIYQPTYGRTGSKTYTVIEYVSSLTIQITDKSATYSGKHKVLYKASVKSRGENSYIAKVMAAMIESLFRDFPGKSGSTRSEKVFY